MGTDFERKKNKNLSTLHIDNKLIEFVAHNMADFEFLVTSDQFKSLSESRNNKLSWWNKKVKSKNKIVHPTPCFQ